LATIALLIARTVNVLTQVPVSLLHRPRLPDVTFAPLPTAYVIALPGVVEQLI
jgi:hypothetical protein